MGSESQELDSLPSLVYWIAALVICVVAVWDTYVTVTGEEHRTVTEIIYLWSRRWPLLPFAAGMLCGHLFWRKR